MRLAFGVWNFLGTFQTGGPGAGSHPQRSSPLIRQIFNEKPALIFWELTQACDLVCRHCRASAKKFCDPNELCEEEGERLIDELAQWSGPMLILTGGDPLKHPSFWHWLEYAREKGVKVSVTPSPTPLVTEAAIFKMKNLGVNRLGLSLDGAKGQTHDYFRGWEGSFARVLQIARWAQRAGLSLQVNTTLTRHNVHELEEMTLWIQQFQAKMWSLFFLIPVGRGKSIEIFTPEVHEAIFERLYKIKEETGIPVKTTEAPHYRRFVLQKMGKEGVRGRGTGDGRGIVFVSRTGDIFPSGFLPLKAGNVREDSIREVYRNSELFKGLRDPDRFKGKCGVCEYRMICGGSRARAFALTGDPYESDPFCAYLPKKIEAVFSQ